MMSCGVASALARAWVSLMLASFASVVVFVFGSVAGASCGACVFPEGRAWEVLVALASRGSSGKASLSGLWSSGDDGGGSVWLWLLGSWLEDSIVESRRL